MSVLNVTSVESSHELLCPETFQTVDPEVRQADTQWFHVFKSMIESGELANISGSAVKVYLVIKSYANYRTGEAFPAETTIAKKAGLSLSQVKRAVKELQQLTYLYISKRGRKNHYQLIEKVLVRNSAGDSAAAVTWNYTPAEVTSAVDELKNYVNSGQADGAQLINIQNLQVNINQVSSGGVVVNNQAAQAIDLTSFDPVMRVKLSSLLKKVGIPIAKSYTQLTDDTCQS